MSFCRSILYSLGSPKVEVMSMFSFLLGSGVWNFLRWEWCARAHQETRNVTLGSLRSASSAVSTSSVTFRVPWCTRLIPSWMIQMLMEHHWMWPITSFLISNALPLKNHTVVRFLLSSLAPNWHQTLFEDIEKLYHVVFSSNFNSTVLRFWTTTWRK